MSAYIPSGEVMRFRVRFRVMGGGGGINLKTTWIAGALS